MSMKAQAEQLQQNLNNLLTQKAILDEQIIGLRNMIQGINMGTQLQQELDAEAKKAAPEEEPVLD